MKSIYCLLGLLSLVFLPSFSMELELKTNDNTVLTRQRSSSDSDISFKTIDENINDQQKTLSSAITISKNKIKRLKKDKHHLKEQLNSNKWASLIIWTILLATNVIIALNCPKCETSDNSSNLPYPFPNQSQTCNGNNNSESIITFLSTLYNSTVHNK